MTRTVAVALFVAVALISLPAAAAPAVFYNPATGGIWMKNDVVRASAFYVVSVAEPWAMKSDPSLFTVIPGTIFDSADLPLGFTYLNFPVTQGDLGVFIGNVVTPGTPASNLYSGYIYPFTTPHLQLSMTVIPEPNAAIITVIALVGLSALRQRWRRDR